MSSPDGCLRSALGSLPLKVKFILPALTEATDPYWRPIKYSLFPPTRPGDSRGFIVLIVQAH